MVIYGSMEPSFPIILTQFKYPKLNVWIIYSRCHYPQKQRCRVSGFCVHVAILARRPVVFTFGAERAHSLPRSLRLTVRWRQPDGPTAASGSALLWHARLCLPCPCASSRLATASQTGCLLAWAWCNRVSFTSKRMPVRVLVFCHCTIRFIYADCFRTDSVFSQLHKRRMQMEYWPITRN